MNKKFSNYFIIGLTILFFVLGYEALERAKPAAKNERIYTEIKPYLPFYLEKRIGGFQILMKGSDVKEKPPIEQVFSRMEELEIGWAQTHLKIDDKTNSLIIFDDNKKEIKKVKFNLPDERIWTEKYFQLNLPL